MSIPEITQERLLLAVVKAVGSDLRHVSSLLESLSEGMN